MATKISGCSGIYRKKSGRRAQRRYNRYRPKSQTVPAKAASATKSED